MLIFGTVGNMNTDKSSLLLGYIRSLNEQLRELTGETAADRERTPEHGKIGDLLVSQLQRA
ncbi:Uncharacterised protein [Salmonella enterica]|uniref:Uncharacterized protein n=1 Tax=Salmonella enterica TaxID=28901 RepID=A0A7D8J0K7_SALER|nr:Uncharacterised protein [Salmonella enterica]